jgi:prepilin-type N-terminal cleavage/methylation domain-containing protein
MNKNKRITKGFTLIELLIVIGILAILASVTLLVLNPAQMFAQARDSQRISDLSTLKSAVSLYLATVTSIDLDASGSCESNVWGTLASTTVSTHSAKSTFQYATGTTSVDGTGWIPVALSSISGGSPVSALPLDPTGINSTLNSNETEIYAYFYMCSTSGSIFELNANLESTRYTSDDNKEANDGGDRDYMYEVGTNLGL